MSTTFNVILLIIFVISIIGSFWTEKGTKKRFKETAELKRKQIESMVQLSSDLRQFAKDAEGISINVNSVKRHIRSLLEELDKREDKQCSFCDSDKPIVWVDVDGKKSCSECKDIEDSYASEGQDIV